MIDPWFSQHLRDPDDRSPLRAEGSELVASSGRRHKVIDGVPMLLPDKPEWLLGAEEVAEALKAAELPPPPAVGDGAIDPYVNEMIMGTNGNLYRHLINHLPRYPIPEIHLPKGNGERLLDIGCGWGRWSVAAAKAGYKPVGIDPKPNAVLAARRVSRQMKADGALFVCGDARSLPFDDGSFDVVYSYSVLQHFPRDVVSTVLKEVRRVLKPGGVFRTQMMTRFGLRCIQKQGFLTRSQSDDHGFAVRFWSIPQLRKTFGDIVGPAEITLDSFFTQAQPSDWDLMTTGQRVVMRAAQATTAIARPITPLAAHFCENVFVTCRKPA